MPSKLEFLREQAEKFSIDSEFVNIFIFDNIVVPFLEENESSKKRVNLENFISRFRGMLYEMHGIADYKKLYCYKESKKRVEKLEELSDEKKIKEFSNEENMTTSLNNSGETSHVEHQPVE